MAISIEKTISELVISQFPDFYKEEGQLFIAFVKAYYEWLESENQVLYHTRRLPEYRDIDTTLDEFILNFKNKYLANVQFNLATNKKLFIKNALEFYRAKGTERAVDLFFKLIYGLEARVYYPGDDLFRLSDNEWRTTQYLELNPNPKNINFVGKQIFGIVSGATAFVERLVRVKKDTQYIEVLYITDVTRDFRTDERIRTFEGDINYTAKIEGSLSSFQIVFSSPGFEVGETVYVSDGKGKKAKAVVSQTTNYTGVVNFEIIDGGWGYTNQAEIIGSERVFKLDNITFENEDWFYHHEPSRRFELIKQDLVAIDVSTANATLAEEVFALPLGTIIYAHTNDDPSNTVIFEGKIVSSSTDTNQIVVNYIDENYRDANNDLILTLYGNTITSFFTSNATIEIPVDTSNPNAVVDATAYANVIDWDSNMTIEYNNASLFTLSAGDILYQAEPNVGQRYTYITVANTYSNSVSGQYFANLTRTVGWPRTNKQLIRQSDGKAFNIVNMSNVYCGAIGYNGEIGISFFDTANTYGSNTRFHSANNDSFSYETEAVFQIFEYDEQQSLKDWFSNEVISEMPSIHPATNTAFVIGDFNDLGNNSIFADNTGILYVDSDLGPVDFANTPIGDFLSISSNAVSIGSVGAIITTNPGRGYARSPFFIVYEPAAKHLERYDYYIRYNLEAELKAFRVGEKITTTNGDTLAEARIRYHNSITGEIHAVRTRISSDVGDPDYLYTSRDFRCRDIIIGEDSGVSAEIFVVDELRMYPRTGINADISSTAFSGDGFVTGLRITSSGFGYFGKRFVNGVLQDGEVLTLFSEESQDRSIQTYGFLGKQGIGEGFHPNRRSFLSSDKYLLDSNYYQDYSYEVLTALPFDKYKQTLIEILHVAGTRPFGSYVGTTEDTVNITTEDSIALWDIKQFPLFINENTFFANTVISTT